jgi:hypothetical protein
MKGKLLFVILAGSIFIVAVINIRLNMQNENHSVFFAKIESLTGEILWGEEDELDLHGSLASVPIRSLPSTLFQATKHSSYITVNCFVNLNNIAVQIVNASGQTVYSNNVNPVAGRQLYISLAGLPAGDYTLTFTSSNGGCIYGYFEI